MILFLLIYTSFFNHFKKQTSKSKVVNLLLLFEIFPRSYFRNMPYFVEYIFAILDSSR